MNNYIINSFILKNENTLLTIFKYLKFNYNKEIKINDIKIELKKLIKNKYINNNNNIYKLTESGNVILNDHKYYYSMIIYLFYKKYSKNKKKYQLKEIRLEQQKLRIYLTNNKEHICIICDKKLPLCLLETAHLKPRFLLNDTEKNDINIVEFMCRYCHNLYDNGYLGINDGLLIVSSLIENYDIKYNKNKEIKNYNVKNKNYFIFHYKYIYNK
jgi:hypothetical protein